jgi:hypothetical protein
MAAVGLHMVTGGRRRGAAAGGGGSGSEVGVGREAPSKPSCVAAGVVAAAAAAGVGAAVAESGGQPAAGRRRPAAGRRGVQPARLRRGLWRAGVARCAVRAGARTPGAGGETNAGGGGKHGIEDEEEANGTRVGVVQARRCVERGGVRGACSGGGKAHGGEAAP